MEGQATLTIPLHVKYRIIITPLKKTALQGAEENNMEMNENCCKIYKITKTKQKKENLNREQMKN